MSIVSLFDPAQPAATTLTTAIATSHQCGRQRVPLDIHATVVNPVPESNLAMSGAGAIAWWMVRVIRQIWPWARKYRHFAIASVIATTIQVAINLIIPLLTSRVIDRGIGGADSSFVVRTGLLMIGMIIFGMFASAASSVFGVRLSFNTVTDLRRDLFDRTQDLSFANLDELSSGEILTRLSSDMTRVTLLVAMGVGFLTQIAFTFFGALIAILSIDPSLVVIVAVMVPVIAGFVAFVIANSNVLYGLVQEQIDRLNTVLQESIHGAEVIKAFVRQDHQIERFDDTVDELAERSIKVNQLVAALFPTLIVVSSLGVAAVIWLGGISVIEERLTEGELVAFISYMALVSFPMMMFAFIQPTISAASASLNRIIEVLATEPAVANAPAALNVDLPAPGAVRFDGVSFRYGTAADSGDAEGLALRNIDLDITPGSTVAILGATGSGKSSLVHLVPRFYDATAGTVSVGGLDVRSLPKHVLRTHVGIALQQPELFSGTVKDNLRFGAPNATDDDLITAAKAAQAHDFITEMPEGYESTIEQGGANLSGGQRQRLAIARTLAARPAVLILDDSTSAVDLETEADIQDALRSFGDTTVILVAQRISSALGADMIVVLDAGRIAACGTHAELLAESSIYQDIYRSQLGALPT